MNHDRRPPPNVEIPAFLTGAGLVWLAFTTGLYPLALIGGGWAGWALANTAIWWTQE